MNRIILIGNGFDLAHGLKTSYKDFIESVEFNDSLNSNGFFKILKSKTSLVNWVDIEEEYFSALKECTKDHSHQDIRKLNKDFSDVKKKLITYLKGVVKNQIGPNDGIKDQKKPNDRIKDIIESEFQLTDFTQQGRDVLRHEEYAEKENKLPKEVFDDFIKRIDKNKYDLLPVYPKHVLFLNFNYTDTESRYSKSLKDGIEQKTIHLHERLGDFPFLYPSPIIFGCGNVTGKDYADIESLNNNHYLENIKHIQYLNKNEYKELLDFISEDRYQIFIFGHSCGNSDRTILKTLFESENCVSIKVFYREKDDDDNDDNDDNYSEIVKNIFRHFTDKTMIDKVVSKVSSELLPQIEE